MPGRFEGKVAFVTGGASGLGAATSARLAEEGARVAIADIDAAGAEELAAVLDGALPLFVDTADSGSVDRAVARTVETYGRIDIVFNNAGIEGMQQPVHEMSDENWQRVRAVNGDGAFHVLRATVRAMIELGTAGAIVNTTSIAGVVGQVNIAPYTFSKTGLVGLTRSVALEVAARGIRVNAIAPTVVMTPLVEHYIATAPDPERMRHRMDTLNPMPGLPTPEDVAALVTFLVSDEARWITGQTIAIDGGYTAR